MKFISQTHILDTLMIEHILGTLDTLDGGHGKYHLFNNSMIPKFVHAEIPCNFYHHG